MVEAFVADNRATVSLGLSDPPAALETTLLLQALTDQPVKLQRLGKADGPNELLQISLSLNTLEVIAIAVIGTFGKAVVSKFAGDLVDWVKERYFVHEPREAESDPAASQNFVHRFPDLVRLNSSRGYTTIINVPPAQPGDWRNSGIELVWDENLSVEENATRIHNALVGAHALQEALDRIMATERWTALGFSEQNSDCSGKITLRDDGGISAAVVIKQSDAGEWLPARLEGDLREVAVRFSDRQP